MIVLPNTDITDWDKYTLYCRLIDFYKYHKKRKYFTETHHIIPKCLGGSDDYKNLVNLPLNIHFKAHYLLSRCTSSYSLFLAFQRMSSTDFIEDLTPELVNEYVVKRTLFLVNKQKSYVK